MAVDAQFINDVEEALEELGAASLENKNGQPRGADVIMSISQWTKQVLSLPGVKYSDSVLKKEGNEIKVNDDAIAQEYVQLPYSILIEPLEGAEMCNAELSEDGTTLTVTNRMGVEKTANVKGAQGQKGDRGDAFTYNDFTPAQIASLKKPATDAANEWTNTYKPQVTQATSEANDAATLANTKAGVAQQAANDANNAASLANTKASEAENVNAALNGTVLSVTNRNGQTTSADVKGPKGDDLHWDDMSEEEKAAMAQMVLDELSFASVETCESIIDELT